MREVSEVEGLRDSRDVTAEEYSEGWRPSAFVDGEEDDSMAEMMVSPTARKVVHCSVVKACPSGGGGKGLARGEIRPTC